MQEVINKTLSQGFWLTTCPLLGFWNPWYMVSCEERLRKTPELLPLGAGLRLGEGEGSQARAFAQLPREERGFLAVFPMCYIIHPAYRELIKD